MTTAGVKITGVDATLSRLSALEKSAKSVAIAAVASGLNVFARECRSAAPGTIKNETGKYMRVSGDKVWGRAGLIKFPREGDGQHGPHGVYLELGTKHITPRRFIAAALQRAMPSARAAMRRAAQQKLERLTRS